MKNRGTISLGELLFIVSMVIPTILMGVFRIWPLFWAFLAFDLVFGAMEIFYTVKTGQTISQHFWDFARQNKGKAIAILISMAVMWAALIYHLGYKM